LTATLLTLLCCAVISSGAANAASHGSHGVARWPVGRLGLGVLSTPSTLAAQAAEAPIGYAYAYLSGGVNTPNGWSSWDTGDGSYAGQFISDAEAAKVIPVFSYYQLRQSNPGARNASEEVGDLENLHDRATMLAYFHDLKLFFQQAATATGPVILQVEPDLWGYLEDASHGHASTVKVDVSASGMPDLKGMPNTAAGLAQAMLVLRDNYAPKVIVAYHDSSWGTGLNVQSSHPTTAQITHMAAESVDFYRSLDARFDAVFTEMSNVTAGYAQAVESQSTTQWWRPIDFDHLGQYMALVHRAVGLPIVLWQIPVGTTTMSNTYQHYADNKLQHLLEAAPAARALLRSYAADGVAAILFGPSQSGDTQVTATTLASIARYYSLGTFRVG
jgi:hypothetical protein